MIASTKPTVVISKKIKSNLAEVDALCLELRTLLSDKDLDEARFAIELLARESLCNAVIHGNRCDVNRRAAFEIRVGQTWVRLQVTDEGDGFAWQKRIDASPCDYETSGRGIALYAMYAERMHFNARGNQIAIWIRKKPKTAKEKGGW